MSKRSPEPTVIAVGPVHMSADEIESLTDGAASRGFTPYRARCLANDVDLGPFAQMQVGPELVVLTFSGELPEELDGGTLKLAYGPEEGGVRVVAQELVTAPAGPVTVQWALAR